MALGAGADIVDLKEPENGALGALSPQVIASCVECVAGRAKLSATIGDLPLEVESIRAAVAATASLGVDYVKLGIFPDEGAERCLRRLEPQAAQTRLILVLFADAMPEFDAIKLAARIGAHGIMLDTLGKNVGSLSDHLSHIALAERIAAAKAEGLIVGLAGSLKTRHVPGLLALEPDLLGFRGALCHEGDRRQRLDPSRLAAVRALIKPNPHILSRAKLPDLAGHALC
jgi:uncharacterized protein (UPF0264 family)